MHFLHRQAQDDKQETHQHFSEGAGLDKMPGSESANELAWISVVESPLAFLDKQLEMSLRYPIIPSQVALRLTPEVLNPIDMCAARAHQLFGVVDPVVLEATRVQGIVGPEAVGEHDGVRLDLAVDDRQQRGPFEVGRQRGVDLAAALQNAEDDNLSSRATPSFALAMAAEIAFVEFDLTTEGAFVCDALADGLAQFVVVERGRVTVDARQIGSRSRGRAGDEVFDEPKLGSAGKFAFATGHGDNMCA